MRMQMYTQIKPGTYRGHFKGVTRTLHEEYGDGVRWDFAIDDKKSGEVFVSRTTKAVASQKNSCGKFFEMVSGLLLKAAIGHDTDEWLGTAGTILVESAPSGDGVRVAQFIRDDAK